jgi:regulator of sigma E protease
MSFDLLSNIGLFVVALASLILLHEFGHFTVSKLFGVQVEEFGIGFPPRLATLFEWRGTKYTLNWILLGGFVRTKGENDTEVIGGLAAASPWVRISVLFAGPAMNFLAGIVIFAIIFLRLGIPGSGPVQIATVEPDSPAAQAGLQVDDLLVMVNDIEITGMEQIQNIIYHNLGKAIRITYERQGIQSEVTLIPRNPPPPEGAIGISMFNPNPPQKVSIFQALGLGVDTLYYQVTEILKLPGRWLSGSSNPEETRLVGYKGMYDIYSYMRASDEEARQADSPLAGVNTLAFFGMITISLGLLNLFPLPALDGGRILFTLPEIILRRRIPAEFENLVNLVGFALLILALIYFNIQDFISPIQLP